MTLYRVAWKDWGLADPAWQIDTATSPMPDWEMDAFLDDQRRHFPNIEFRAVAADQA